MRAIHVYQRNDHELYRNQLIDGRWQQPPDLALLANAIATRAATAAAPYEGRFAVDQRRPMWQSVAPIPTHLGVLRRHRHDGQFGRRSDRFVHRSKNG
ncbi:hypothetical protein GCM10010199_00890 [Dactylosporangium roseum]